METDRPFSLSAVQAHLLGKLLDAETKDPRKAVEQLIERDRLALLMREEGLDYDEIAEALKLSRGSIGTTLARARRRLVQIYEALQRDGRKDGKNVAS